MFRRQQGPVTDLGDQEPESAEYEHDFSAESIIDEFLRDVDLEELEGEDEIFQSIISRHRPTGLDLTTSIGTSERVPTPHPSTGRNSFNDMDSPELMEANIAPLGVPASQRQMPQPISLADMLERELQHARHNGTETLPTHLNHLANLHNRRPLNRGPAPPLGPANIQATQARPLHLPPQEEDFASGTEGDDPVREFLARLGMLYDTPVSPHTESDQYLEEQLSSAGLLEVTVVQALGLDTSDNNYGAPVGCNIAMNPTAIASALAAAGGRPPSWHATVKVEGANSSSGISGETTGPATHSVGGHRCPVWDKVFLFEVVDFFGPAKIEVEVFAKHWLGQKQPFGNLTIPMKESLKDVSRERWHRRKQAKGAILMPAIKSKEDPCLSSYVSPKVANSVVLVPVEVCDCLCYPFLKGKQCKRSSWRQMTQDEAEHLYLEWKLRKRSGTKGSKSDGAKQSSSAQLKSKKSGDSEALEEKKDESFRFGCTDGPINDSWYHISKTASEVSAAPSKERGVQLPGIRLRLRYLPLLTCCEPSPVDGMTELHRAALQGRVDIISAAVTFYGKMMAGINSGFGHARQIRSHPLMVECLDADPVRNMNGFETSISSARAPSTPVTPLECALRHRQQAVAEFLFNEYPNLAMQSMDSGRSCSCLHAAVMSGELPILKMTMQHLMTKAPGPAERLSIIDLRDLGGVTPFALACQLGLAKCAEYLLKNGANPATRDLDGNTPLIQACQNGHLEVVKLLMKEERNFEDEKNLQDAGYSHSRAVRLACQPTSVNQEGNSAVMIAAKQGHTEILRTLMESGVVYRCRDKHGRTPLHFSAEAGRLSTLKLLLDALEKDASSAFFSLKEVGLLEGGHFTAFSRDIFGQTALSLAKKNGHDEIVEYLQMKAPNEESAPVETKAPICSREGSGDSFFEDSEYEYTRSVQSCND